MNQPNLPTDFEDEVNETEKEKPGQADQADKPDDQADKPDDQADNSNKSTVAPKDNDGVPYCADHHCRMTQRSGGSGSAKYYKCPAKGCDQTAKKIKLGHPNVVPSRPMVCPVCSKIKTKDGKPVRTKKGEQIYEESHYLTRDGNLSTSAMVVLKCKRCNFTSQHHPTPAFADAHMRHREEQKKQREKIDQRLNSRDNVGRR